MTDHVFSIVPMEVWQDKRLSLEQIRVLGVLLSFRAKNTDVVYPKRSAIAERCGMAECKISEATTALVSLGWLVKEGKGGFSKSTRYSINVPESVTVTQSVTVDKTKKVTEKVTVPESVTVTEKGTRPVTDSVTVKVTESVTRKEQTIEQTNRTDQLKPMHQSKPATASRLPTDWQPSDSEIEFCKTERPELDPVFVADMFRDYWISAAGAKGRKADWTATWRNWVRNQNAPRQTGNKFLSKAEQVKQANDRAAAEFLGRNNVIEGEVIHD